MRAEFRFAEVSPILSIALLDLPNALCMRGHEAHGRACIFGNFTPAARR